MEASNPGLMSTDSEAGAEPLAVSSAQPRGVVAPNSHAANHLAVERELSGLEHSLALTNSLDDLKLLSDRAQS